MLPGAGSCWRNQARRRSPLGVPESSCTLRVSLRSHTACAWITAMARAESSRRAPRKRALGKCTTRLGFRAVAVAGKASSPNMAASAKEATGSTTARVGWALGASPARVSWMAPSTST